MMQDRRVTGQVGLHDRRDAGHEGCRTGGMQPEIVKFTCRGISLNFSKHEIEIGAKFFSNSRKLCESRIRFN